MAAKATPHTQTQTAPPAAAPVPQAAAVPPRREKYGTTILARVNRIAGRANESEYKFLESLLGEWEIDGYNLIDATFMHTAKAFNINWIDPDEFREHAAEVKTLYGILVGDDWLASFLKRFARWYNDKTVRPQNPEDLLFMVEQDLDDFDGEVDTAREMLANHPEVLADEIRAAASKLQA